MRRTPPSDLFPEGHLVNYQNAPTNRRELLLDKRQGGPNIRTQKHRPMMNWRKHNPELYPNNDTEFDI